MKKLIILAIISAAVSLLAAEAINLNKNFAADAKGVPSGWQLNKGPDFLPLGTVTLVPGEMGQNSVRMVSNGKEVHYFYNKKFATKAGEKITIRAKISGKGRVALGGYFYGEKSKWGYSVYHPFFTAQEAPQVVSRTIDVVNRPNGPVIQAGVIVLVAAPGADVTVTQLDAEIEPLK